MGTDHTREKRMDEDTVDVINTYNILYIYEYEREKGRLGGRGHDGNGSHTHGSTPHVGTATYVFHYHQLGGFASFDVLYHFVGDLGFVRQSETVSFRSVSKISVFVVYFSVVVRVHVVYKSERIVVEVYSPSYQCGRKRISDRGFVVWSAGSGL